MSNDSDFVLALPKAPSMRKAAAAKKGAAPLIRERAVLHAPLTAEIKAKTGRNARVFLDIQSAAEAFKKRNPSEAPNVPTAEEMAQIREEQNAAIAPTIIPSSFQFTTDSSLLANDRALQARGSAWNNFYARLANADHPTTFYPAWATTVDPTKK